MGMRFIALILFVIGMVQTQNTNDLYGSALGILSNCPKGSECVPLHRCKDNNITKNAEVIIDIRFDPEAPPQWCSNLERCCPFEDKATETFIRIAVAPEGCGYRNKNGIGAKFRTNGDEDQQTQFGEFPWMVALLIEQQIGSNRLHMYQCGASIITPGVLITAAHCVHRKDPLSLVALAGEWDTQTKAEILPDQNRRVVEVVVHPDFYSGGLFNDIALLFLEKPFEISENVKPVCLPPASINFDGSRCFATGWGKDKFGEIGKYQAILKKIDLPIVPRDICQAELRKERLGDLFELHKSFICAGGESAKDTCTGDGGSPLVCPIPGDPERYYQAGIVAWGLGCANSIPAVYASVATLRPWIDEQLSYKRVNSSFYTP